jgi:hypothetical protein
MQYLSARVMTRVCLLTIFLASFAALTRQTALAQQTWTVAKLMDFMRSSIELKNPDKDVAGIVSGIRLSEKFTLADLQELQNAGVGPKSLAALSALVTKSAALSAPAPKPSAMAKPAGPPDPSEAEKREVLQQTRDWALDYVKSLPDFLCLEDTNRSVDRHFQPGGEGNWTPQDRLIEKLTFFDHKENYELFMHNDTAVVNKTSDSLGGARSTGEWASLLSEIFEPATHTGFRWVAWKTVRGKLVYEYSYLVERQDSRETIAHGDQEKIIAGFHGSVFIQKGQNVVLRVTVTPDIPPNFPVQDVDQTVDYDYQDIGGQQFLLPLKSVVQMRDGSLGTLNEIRWRSYRKYSADTTLTFDDVDTAAPSDDQKNASPSPKK